MIEQIIQSLFIIAATGLILFVLYQIAKMLGSLFVIGLIGFLAFTEVYGIYLFFTERYLYVEDLATNGILSFTTFYIIFNLLLVFGLVRKVVEVGWHDVMGLPKLGSPFLYCDNFSKSILLSWCYLMEKGDSISDVK